MNNPKAFPVIIGSGDNPNTNEKYFYANEGMDLRDYFAAKAMQSIMNNEEYDMPLLDEDMEECSEGGYTKNYNYNRYYHSVHPQNNDKRYEVISSHEQRIAREAYKLADAMLIARETKEEKK